MAQFAHSLERLEARIAPAVLTVTSALDDGSPGTLRQVLASTHLTPEADVIVFQFSAPTTFITLQSEIPITDAVTIDGPGAGHLVISGNGHSRIFNIDDATATDVPVIITGLSLINGRATGDGGAIRSLEPLILDSSVVANSTATGDGGGIFIDTGGNFILNNSRVFNNSAGGNGGGFSAQALGNLIVNSSYLLRNMSGQQGGAGYAQVPQNGTGDIYLVGSSLVANHAATGGGALSLANFRFGADERSHTADDGRDILYNTLVSANSCTTQGGGLLFDRGQAMILNSTLSNNQAVEAGGGVFTTGFIDSLLISQSMLARNSTTDGAMPGGGGLFLSPASVPVATVQSSAFIANTSASAGGGLVSSGLAVGVTGSSFESNSAASGSGGAIAVGNSGNFLAALSVTGSQFLHNSASADGGAISSSSDGALAFTMVAFTGNVSGGDGGAVHTASAAPIAISTVSVSGNIAHGSGGGLYLDSSGAVGVSSVLVSNNLAESSEGGGLVFSGPGAKTLSLAQVSGNFSTSRAGGVSNLSTGSLALAQCLITGNVTLGAEGGLFVLPGSTVSGLATVVLVGNTSSDGTQSNQ